MTQQHLHHLQPDAGFGAPAFEAHAPTVAMRTGPAREPAAEPAEHPLFRPTEAFRHDTRRPAIDPDRVTADWVLMYEWLERDPEMAAVCGFTTADLTQLARSTRIRELRAEVGPGRTFTVLPTEMQFWVRYSWINSDRCSGRQHALQSAVIQYRPEVRSATDMLRAVVEHANTAMNAPVPPQTVITVLGTPTLPDRLGPTFVTEQLMRPAGYRTADGRWTGDGGYLDVTDWVSRFGPGLIQPVPGYRPGTFDVLPMLAMGADGELAMGTCPPASQYLVDIPWPQHPDGPHDPVPDEPFALWPAVPLQTNFDLDIAGQRYCVIFNGWYVDEEIATNFLDVNRFDWADRIGAVIHGPAHRRQPAGTDRFDEYRMAQIEIATLRAVRAGFKSARMKLNNLTPSQNGFAKFCQRHLATHGEAPPNDTGWTSNRIGSRFRYASHPVPHVPQERGARLVKHWLTVRSLRPGVEVQITDLDANSAAYRAGRHALTPHDLPPDYGYGQTWEDDARAAAPQTCPVSHSYPPM